MLDKIRLDKTNLMCNLWEKRYDHDKYLKYLKSEVFYKDNISRKKSGFCRKSHSFQEESLNIPR